MLGNPHECRLNAALCAQLAETAATPELRETCIALAESWKRLAAELDSAQAFLDAMSELELRDQPSEASVLKLHDRAA